MNFHKTIGFLATLLLTLGLGVPDSFAQPVTTAQVKTLELSFDPMSVNEGDGQRGGKLVATVTLKGPATADQTETVMLAPATPPTRNTIDLAVDTTDAVSYTHLTLPTKA